ncbi:MAG TPA: AAA family ATPase [Mycobacteriales bacterium]|nr:AAA family ATPase [Mycobacteriales bacterium]
MPQRVLVGGISGAGKSTLARELAAAWQLPYVELDALFHGPGWTERPTFAQDVAEVVTEERWVVDSDGYPAVRDLLWARADTLVWLDLPRWQVMARVVRRSVWRGLQRAELWNGNRETFRAWADPGHPVRWAWTQHGARRTTIETRLADPRWAHLRVVRLESARAARRWREQLDARG